MLAQSGEIGFEVIGHKQCGGLEVQRQLEFNCSNKSTNETLEWTTCEQDLGLELSWRFQETAPLGATESMINVNNRFHYV